MSNKGVASIVIVAILIILVLASIGYLTARINKPLCSSCPSGQCIIGTSECWQPGMGVASWSCPCPTTTTTPSKPSCPYECCNKNDLNYQPKACPLPLCPKGVNPCPMPVCQDHHCIVSPVQILSVQTIPANPKVGDFLSFNITIKNEGSIPVYFGYPFSVSYSNENMFQPKTGNQCPAITPAIGTINPNQVLSLSVDCWHEMKILSSGSTNANLTFEWGYQVGNFINTTSFVYSLMVTS